MTAIPEPLTKSKYIPRWGGLWETVSSLPDWDDVKQGFQREAAGFAALEACTTIDQVKDTMVEFFKDKAVRNRLNSVYLDQLALLFLVPTDGGVYTNAITFGFTDVLLFLLDMKDQKVKHLQLALRTATTYQRAEIVEYLTKERGVLDEGRWSGDVHTVEDALRYIHDLTDEVVYEIKRLTGYSFVRLFGWE